MIQVQETTESRRFATHFIRKAEAAQRVLETIRAAPLPVAKSTSAPKEGAAGSTARAAAQAVKPAAKKLVWGAR